MRPGVKRRGRVSARSSPSHPSAGRRRLCAVCPGLLSSPLIPNFLTMTDTLLPDYDFLVIGAGPAGLLAAMTLADGQTPRGSRTIALLDKRDPWREPVSCAEAV